MSNPSNANDAKRIARRRLLRGAYAVPAVLTVHTGSALATSSALACFNKLPTGVDIGLPDNYWRVKRYTVTRPDNTTTKCVNANEIISLCNSKSPSIDKSWLTGRTWIKVSDGTDVTAKSGTTPSHDTDKWVAIRISNIGSPTTPVWKVTGVSPSSTGGTGSAKVMAQSCWNSFVLG